MHKKSRLLYLFPLLIITACSNNKTTESYSTDVGEGKSITIDAKADSNQKTDDIFPDTLLLKVKSSGENNWQPEANLQKAVQDSLLKLYLKNGKLPSRLDIVYEKGIMSKTKEKVQKKLHQAIVVLINVISVKELDQAYSQLNPKKQQEFQKQYPLLFQKE